ncbi:MAG: DUF2332 domain-containing protein [Pseudomonadota bacterium]
MKASRCASSAYKHLATAEDVNRHFVEQGLWCAPSPFTQALLAAMHSNYNSGGVVSRLADAWPNTIHRDAFALRLAGALHFASLTRMSAGLAAKYPESNSDWEMADIWPIACEFLEAEFGFVNAFLASPPQTNEVNRCFMLLPGFLEVAKRFGRPFHQLELGASAGLNQFWDRYAYRTSHWKYGADSSVVLETDWDTQTPETMGGAPSLASTASCDLRPIDVRNEQESLRLQSYTWADQQNRLDRLRGAIQIAVEQNKTPEEADALEWLRRKLRSRPEGEPTVVYHSVFLHYPPPEIQKALEELIKDTGRRATERSPFAWVCYESQGFFGRSRSFGKMIGQVTTWPGGDQKIYGLSDGHVMHVVDV